jgi:membrane protein
MLFDYIAFIFLVPIFIVLTSGVSIFVATKSKELGEYVAPVVSTIITLMPYVIMSLGFICLYVFMPNTKVRLKNAVAPGILAGVCMQVLQFVYIHSQIWVSSYNAIYGSFAALPLFMLWLQISWTIALVGALLCYTNQNHEDLAFLMRTVKISHRYKLMLSILIMSILCKRFKEGKKPINSVQLKDMLALPNRIVTDLLADLQTAGLVEMIQNTQDREYPAFVPACDIHQISLGMMVDRLESIGPWHLDTSVDQYFSQRWKEVLQLRSDYLKNLDSILLHEL